MKRRRDRDAAAILALLLFAILSSFVHYRTIGDIRALNDIVEKLETK